MFVIGNIAAAGCWLLGLLFDAQFAFTEGSSFFLWVCNV